MINSEVIQGLEPAIFWHYLAEICEIPHGSGNEAEIREYVIGQAKKNGLAYKVDEAGNLIVIHPATAGLEHLPSIALQGHLDMVCEKEKETVHDFEKDPIRLIRDGNIMRADKTTAGFDNAVAVAAEIMLMDDTEPHGPREYLFTVEEETGMKGAKGIKSGFIASKTLINLDTEDEGILFFGCAGNRQTKGTHPLVFEKSPLSAKCVLAVSGLKSGHSGLEIHEKRGNAIKILTHVLLILNARTNMRIASINGGEKHNVIPFEAEAQIFIPRRQTNEAVRIVRQTLEGLKEYFGSDEPKLSITLDVAEKDSKELVYKTKYQKKVLKTLFCLPHGVYEMSTVIPDLVETSNNLAAVKQEKGNIVILTSQRSMSDEGMEKIYSEVKSVFGNVHFKVEQISNDPVWTPDINSPILAKAASVYKTIFGNEPKKQAIHAALECALFKHEFPEMDIASFGPTLKKVHTTEEFLLIDTIPLFIKHLKALLSAV